MTSNDVLPIHPMGPVHATVRPPGSKSITNRALICAALAEGRSSLQGALDSEDTRVMYEALAALGIALGLEPRPWPDHRGGKWLACGRVTRRICTWPTAAPPCGFWLPMLATGAGHYRLDGAPRMRARPIGDLLHALRQLGATVDSETHNDCPPW